MNSSTLIGGILFGGIGFVAFVFGKKTGRPKAMGIGAALSVYTFFTPDTGIWVYGIGCALTALLFVWRDE
jgi:hypothetical protein